MSEAPPLIASSRIFWHVLHHRRVVDLDSVTHVRGWATRRRSPRCPRGPCPRSASPRAPCRWQSVSFLTILPSLSSSTTTGSTSGRSANFTPPAPAGWSGRTWRRTGGCRAGTAAALAGFCSALASMNFIGQVVGVEGGQVDSGKPKVCAANSATSVSPNFLLAINCSTKRDPGLVGLGLQLLGFTLQRAAPSGPLRDPGRS